MHAGVGAAARERVAAVRAALPAESRYVARIVVTAAVAWQVCVWFGATHPPVYAVVVALVAMRDAPYSAFNVSIGRLVGVVAGLSIGIGVLTVLPLGVVSMSVVLAVALAVAIVLRTGGSLNVQVAASALLVFASETPSSYAVTRLWETAAGAVVTVVLAPLLFPTNPARAFLADRARVAAALAVTFREAGRLAAGDPGTAGAALAGLAADARRTENDARGLVPNLADARRAVRLNPLWRRHTGLLPGEEDVEPVAGDVAAMARLFVDELRELSGRPDLNAWWSASGPLTVQVTEPLAQMAEARLSGRADRAEGRSEAALLRHAAADGSRFGAVIRRPLRRALRLLAGSNAPDLAP